MVPRKKVTIVETLFLVFWNQQLTTVVVKKKNTLIMFYVFFPLFNTSFICEAKRFL